MFLATTARTDFWDTSSQPMLFLGEWCLRRDRRQEWEHLERRVLPSPWDDRAELHRAAEYLDEFGERLLSSLAEFLNSLHQVRHDVRYWCVLLGSWVLDALHCYYDRWVSVRDALRDYPDLTTLVLDQADRRHALCAAAWSRSLSTDEFNLQLYSEVFEALGCRFPARRFAVRESAAEQRTLRAFLRDAALNSISTIGATAVRMIPGGVLLHQTAGYLTAADRARLVIDSGFRVWPFEAVDEHSSHSPVSETRRAEMNGFPARGEFERFFIGRLAEMLPTTVVEEYETRCRLARKVPSSRVVATFGGWYGSEMFCFTAAEAHARGARLVAVQHGGGYGVLESGPAERLERRIADRFLAWGWGDERKHPDVTNASAGSLAHFHRLSRDASQANEILFLATGHPRYLYRFHSAPVGSQWLRYYEWQERFLDALPAHLRPYLRFRDNRFAVEYGQAQHERLASRFPWLQWDYSRRLSDSLRRARLVIADHHGTSALQVFAAGVPQILFWDPALWELREEAEGPFNDLRKRSILFDDPESAAAVTARVYAAAEAWWTSPEVANARDRFTNHFGLYRDDWPREWARTLANVSRRPTEIPMYETVRP